MDKAAESFTKIVAKIGETGCNHVEGTYEDFLNIKKAINGFANACQYIADALDECPVCQDLIEDLDCDNCNDDLPGCWRKYFEQLIQK